MSTGTDTSNELAPPASQLNGNLERTHRSHQHEFYQLMTFKDDVDLVAKLGE